MNDVETGSDGSINNILSTQTTPSSVDDVLHKMTKDDGSNNFKQDLSNGNKHDNHYWILWNAWSVRMTVMIMVIFKIIDITVQTWCMFQSPKLTARPQSYQ
jgi:hypothetical protein